VIREIQAKTLLSTVRQVDSWFGLGYTMNLYRGCQHQCIYCDSRSECYQIQDFTDVLVKVNAVELLQRELASKRRKGTVGTGSMNDPYMPLEQDRRLTQRALEVIAQQRFPVHIITKSDLVLRDLETLCTINQVYAAVSFTVTAADDGLAARVEPGAPPPSARFQAMASLAARGILTGVTMMPILPYIGDSEDNITEIVQAAQAHGARYIIPWFGMSLRDRQRAYYYERLDELFPGLRQRYEQRYGDRYSCTSPRAAALEQAFKAACERAGLATRMPVFEPEPVEQLSLF
jgi:DNA repair photolyase